MKDKLYDAMTLLWVTILIHYLWERGSNTNDNEENKSYAARFSSSDNFLKLS
jgi:hypothetical protein